jgi:hypothetical protein
VLDAGGLGELVGGGGGGWVVVDDLLQNFKGGERGDVFLEVLDAAVEDVDTLLLEFPGPHEVAELVQGEFDHLHGELVLLVGDDGPVEVSDPLGEAGRLERKSGELVEELDLIGDEFGGRDVGDFLDEKVEVVGLEAEGDVRQDLEDGEFGLHDALDCGVPDELEVRNLDVGLVDHVLEVVGGSLDELDVALLAVDLFENLVGFDELVEVGGGDELGAAELQVLDDVKEDLKTLELSFQEVGVEADGADFELEDFKSLEIRRGKCKNLVLFRDGDHTLEEGVERLENVFYSLFVEVSEVGVGRLEEVLPDGILELRDEIVTEVSVENCRKISEDCYDKGDDFYGCPVVGVVDSVEDSIENAGISKLVD